MDTPDENERELLPEIVVDEAAEDYVVMDEPEDEPEPSKSRAAAEEESVVVQPEMLPAPEQDNIFQTGKPVKKKRNVSEKQRAHLERIRSKALERKKEKAAERKAARAAVQASAPKVEVEPAAYSAPAPHS